jgi:hypothetical protein
MLCPLCQNETRSKNKGCVRHRTCRSCGHEFTTIEIIKEPEMNTKQKLEKFIKDRKKSVDTATLAAYFMVNATTVNHAMGELVREEKIIQTKAKGGKNIWGWNYQLAVSKPPAPVRHRPEPTPRIGPPTKEAKSYPHVRGYDD